MSLDVVPGDPRWGQGRSARSSGYRSRTYYLPDDLHFRLRNAWWHTQTEPGGHDSISELVAFALLPVVEELEARYNGGAPFAEIPDRRRPKAGPSGHDRQAHAVRLRTALRHGGTVPTDTADTSSAVDAAGTTHGGGAAPTGDAPAAG